MKISKTTLNFAKKRGLAIVLSFDEMVKSSVQIKKNQSAKKALVKFENNQRGLFFMRSSLDQSIKEELPYWVTSDKHLREVIAFIHSEMKK
jgi:DUF2075 family protein